MFSRQYLGTNNPAEILSETDMKYMSLLDEKSKRRFLATKAISPGCHGVTWVAEASRVNRDTIYKGIHELKADEQTRHPLSSILFQVHPNRAPYVCANNPFLERSTTVLSGNGKTESCFHKDKQRAQSTCCHQQQIL